MTLSDTRHGKRPYPTQELPWDPKKKQNFENYGRTKNGHATGKFPFQNNPCRRCGKQNELGPCPDDQKCFERVQKGHFRRDCP